MVEQYIAEENREDINIILSHEENLLGTAGTLNKHLDFSETPEYLCMQIMLWKIILMAF